MVIIIGILAVIALPSFLNQSNKARLSEAQSYVGATLRGQQTFYLERNRFAGDFSELGVNLPQQTENYSYSIAPTSTEAVTIADPTTESLAGVAGKIYLIGEATNTVQCIGQPGTIPDTTGVLLSSQCPQ